MQSSSSPSSAGIDMAAVHNFLSSNASSSYASRAGRRFMYRITRLGLALVAMIPFAAALFFVVNSNNDDFSLSRVIWGCTCQLVGALCLYVANQWRASLLPGAPDDRLHLVLIVGACCFSDGVLNAHQTMLLCLGEIFMYFGMFVCMLGTLCLYLNYLNTRDEGSNTSFVDMVIFFGLALPCIAWYYLVRLCHRRFWPGRAETYGTVAPEDNQTSSSEVVPEDEQTSSAEVV